MGFTVRLRPPRKSKLEGMTDAELFKWPVLERRTRQDSFGDTDSKDLTDHFKNLFGFVCFNCKTKRCRWLESNLVKFCFFNRFNLFWENF